MKKYVACRVIATAPLSSDKERRTHSGQFAIVARQPSQGRGTLMPRPFVPQQAQPSPTDPNTAVQNLLFNRTYGSPSFSAGELLNIAV